MNYRYSDAPAARTRREALALEQKARGSRRLRADDTSTAKKVELPNSGRPNLTNILRSSAKGGTAVTLVALLIGTYLLPAYAASESTVAAGDTSKFVPLQSIRVSDSASASSLPFPLRDSVSVIKIVPDSASYSRVAGTFTNVQNSPLQWPFLVGVPISSWFGYRSCDGCPVFHKGIDINPGLGTPIQAIADGVVTEMGPNDADYGTNVVITHQIDGQTISSRYAHMIEGSSPLTVGDVVAVGDLVGQVGNTGISTGAHLHFEILLDGATPTDPYVWMKEKIGS